MVSEFERKAWNNRTSAEQHKPELALKIALDDMTGGAPLHPVIHAIVVLVHEHDGEQIVGYYQAGSLSTFAMEGALGRAIAVSQRSE